MKTLGKKQKTGRGFGLIQFSDCYGMECSLQASSLTRNGNDPGTTAVWLGREPERMHLDRKQVTALIGHLQNWLDTGEF